MAKDRQLPPPKLLAALICDQVIRDRTTLKPSLIGVFSDIHTSKFPAVHPRMTLFFQLTNGHGKVKLTIRLVDVGNNEEEIHEPLEGEITFQDARQTLEFEIEVLNVMIQHEGEYRVQIFSGSDLLGERQFYVRPLNQKTKED